MATLDESDERRKEAARRVVEQVRRRVALNEAIGILQVWQACGRQQARDDLHAIQGMIGQDAEATRMIAVVNAAADGLADPDTEWD